MKNILIVMASLLFSYSTAKAQDSVDVTLRYRINYEFLLSSLLTSGAYNIVLYGNMGNIGARRIDTDMPLNSYQNFNSNNYMEIVTIGPSNSYRIFEMKLRIPSSMAGTNWYFTFIFINQNSSDINGVENPAYYTEEAYTSCFETSYFVQILNAAYFYPSSNGLPDASKIRKITVPAQDATIELCYGSCLTCGGSNSLSESPNYILRNRTFLDINEDGILSSQDISLPNAPVAISNSLTDLNGFSGNLGNFTTLLDSGNYQVSASSFEQFISLNPTQNITIDSSIEVLFFPYELNSDFYDLVVGYLPGNMVIGFPNQSQLFVRNEGNSVAGINVNLTLPDSVGFINANPSPTSINGNHLSWLIDSLNVFEQYNISLITNIPPPPIFIPGDLTAWDISVDPISNEADTQNNYLTYNIPVLGSYDPNDKIMLKGPKLEPSEVNIGETFHYRIRFQNTGNYPATFIHVRDTLSESLNFSSFKMVYASHDYSLIIRNERYLDWYFPNIQLPDSASDPDGSIGQILYEIMPDLPVYNGDFITNTAYIYFDFNPAIITNTEITHILDPVGLPKYNGKFFPLMFRDAIGNIVFPEFYLWKHIEIYTIDGRLLFSGIPNALNPISKDFSNNLVIIKVVNNKGEYSSRILK